MTRFSCEFCPPPLGAKHRFHDNFKQCPFRPEYDPAVKGAVTKDGKSVKDVAQVVVDTPKKPEAPAPRPVAQGGLTASSKPAEIVAVKKIIKPQEPVDFIVDAQHTRAVVDRGFGVVYQVVLWYDEWREWTEHMPREQFRLSELGLMSIENEPRNMYARGVTAVCMWVGCKTQAQAHHAIDTVMFFGDFGAFFVLIVKHVMKVEKAWKKAHPKVPKRQIGLTREQRETALPAEGRELAVAPA